ncbi:MAG: macro domain-containing protein [Aggregatilineales bacterium]
MKAKVNKVSIEVIQGNQLALTTDAIVIPANTTLDLSDEMIALVGESVQHECRQIGWCDVGSAVITTAGNLQNATKLIHTVGPHWGEGAERGKLANATWRCLELAEENQIASLSFPAISVGTLGYPVENCARTMLEKIIDFTFEPLKSVRHVTLCFSEKVTFDIFEEEFNRQLENLKESGEGKVRV